MPDKNGHGVLTFRVPRLKAGKYTKAAWCPSCAAHSYGRTFFTYPDNEQILPRYRVIEFLRVEAGGSTFPWSLAVGLLVAVISAVASSALFLRRRTRRLSAG